MDARPPGHWTVIAVGYGVDQDLPKRLQRILPVIFSANPRHYSAPAHAGVQDVKNRCEKNRRRAFKNLVVQESLAVWTGLALAWRRVRGHRDRASA